MGQTSSVNSPQTLQYSGKMFTMIKKIFISLAIIFNLTSADVKTTKTIRLTPSIISIPPPVSYFYKSDSGLSESRLTCQVWPPNANVSILTFPFLYNTAFAASPSPFQGLPSESYNQRTVILPPTISNSINFGEGGGNNRLPSPYSTVAAQIQLTDSSEVWRLDSMDLHCRASTQFATLISAPFKIIHARIGEYGYSELQSGKHRLDQPQLTVVKQFIQGNTAYVSCELPLDSQPPPIVQFHVNGSLVDNSKKYLKVQRPNENRVYLLIAPFKTADVGEYRCSVMNPVTLETIWSPQVTQLNINIAQKPIANSILLPLTPNIGLSNNSVSSQFIEVNEGDNITLFCIMQGAPPPRVTTYRFSGTDKRFELDQVFGLLRITNVQLRDNGTYMCSNHIHTSNAVLKVKARLRITEAPINVQIPEFGAGAELRCISSDVRFKPFWLFNGIPKRSNGASLVINSVQESDLGVYQCIVRSLTIEGRADEWVSASAIISLKSDVLITKAMDLSSIASNSVRRYSEPIAAITSEMTPKVEVLFDNLAIYLVWRVEDETLRQGLLTTTNNQQSIDASAWNHPMNFPSSINVVFKIEFAIQLTKASLNPALIGLVEPEPPSWSDTQTIPTTWKDKYAFIVGNPLQPNNTYRFRVRAINEESGKDLISPSGWSKSVSTEHISTVLPPRITSVQPYPHNLLNVTWEYTGLHTLNEGLKTKAVIFQPDFFLILSRTIPKQNQHLNDDMNTPSYGLYETIQVNGSSAREGFVYNLNSSLDYQVIVYGVKLTNGFRQITRFSDPVIVTLPSTPVSRFSFLESLMKNKLIYICLGSLAVAMLIVIFILTILCICRQRKDRNRRRVKQNGFGPGSDSDKYQHQLGTVGTTADSQLLHLPASPTGKVGNSLHMTNLSRSGFDEMDQDQQHHQQQPLLPHPGYTGNPMHSLPHNSQLMMNSGGVGSNGGYYQQYYPMNHHQSHHSLLISPSVGSHGGPPVFQSGTLPGGPSRYMRQQMPSSGYHIQQGPAIQHQFGSQQLNQSVVNNEAPIQSHQQNMDQVSLMRDYYHHQYQNSIQQQPPFMYQTNTATGHMSTIPGETVSRRQSHQPNYYSGTNNSSLKRELPSCGSIQDACGMDATLLARSQMSPSGMQGAIEAPLASQLAVSPPVYFNGSQQALHMTPSVQFLNNAPPPGIQLRQQQRGYPTSPNQQMSMYQQQNVAMMQQMSPHQPISPFYGVQTPTGVHPDPAIMRHQGFGNNTDGDSIYSYFSQQDVCHAPQHSHLNPLPEESHMNPGFAESGSQTAGLNGNLTGNSATGSPTPNGAHRHHRRRKRKQQFQQPGDVSDSPAHENSLQQQQYDGGYDDQHVIDSQREKLFTTLPAAAAGLDQNPCSPTTDDAYQSRINQSLDSTTSYIGVGIRGGLPPPSQPPPPPPAPQMGLPPPNYYRYQHSDVSHVDSLGNNRPIDSLNLSGGAQTGGLLVGPPPRIRDYSEYGIPTGIHPTPSATKINSSANESGSPKLNFIKPQCQPPFNGTSSVIAPMNGVLQSPFNGRYREGQA